MRALATIMGIIAPATAFAASGASGEGSSIFIWIFLGFFAVIVVGQLVPAVMLITGLIKAFWFGVIISIDDVAINLRELVQDSGGEWVERNSALSLVETKK